MLYVKALKDITLVMVENAWKSAEMVYIKVCGNVMTGTQKMEMDAILNVT